MTDRSRWFASTEWLASHLADPEIVVIDGSWHLPGSGRDARQEYEAAHIPGAVFFDIDAIADTANPLPHMLPSAEVFADAAGALGIDENQKIVVYDSVGLSSAPRVWWTFRIMGARDVVILEGGLPKWRSEGRPLDDKPVARPPRRFAARFDPSTVRDMAAVRDGIAAKTFQLVDARPAVRFRGEAPEPRSWVKIGPHPRQPQRALVGPHRRGPTQGTGRHSPGLQRCRRRSRGPGRHQLRLGRQRGHPVAGTGNHRHRQRPLRWFMDRMGRPRRHAGGNRNRSLSQAFIPGST